MLFLRSRLVPYVCITLLTLVPILETKAREIDWRNYGRALQSARSRPLMPFLETVLRPIRPSAHEPQQVRPRASGPAERAAAVLGELTLTLERLASDLSTVPLNRPSRSAEQLDRVEEAIAAFAALEAGMFAELDRVGKALEDRGLPESLLQHHRETMAFLEERLDDIEDGLGTLTETHDPQVQLAAVRDVLALLEGTAAGRPHRMLDAENLPFREAGDEVRAPAQDAVALRSLLSQPEMSLGIAAPSVEDLAETLEVTFTQEIHDLAEQLDGNPVAIFNWVHNNIRYVLTHGSLQGAALTLANKAGNAFDTSSLLIALLRSSGTPARYAYGTVEVPIEVANNWAGGLESGEATLRLMAGGGIPSAGVYTDNELEAVQLEHCWVEAYLDFVPGRGAVQEQGDRWVPLDASFKRHDFQDPVDLPTADLEGFAEDLIDSVAVNEAESWFTLNDLTLIETQSSVIQQLVEDFVANTDSEVLEQSFRRPSIRQRDGPVAANLPYRLVARGDSFVEVPDSFRHRIRVELVRESEDLVFSYSVPTATIAGKQLAISFAPANADSVAILEAIAEEENLSPFPGYLIQLFGELSLDGVSLRQGGLFPMGTPLSIRMGFKAPDSWWVMTENSVIAGEYHALAVDLQGDSGTQILALRDQVQNTLDLFANPEAEVTKHETVGALTQAGAYTYFYRFRVYDQLVARGAGLTRTPLPSIGAMSSLLQPVTFFGVPSQVDTRGIGLDVGLLRSKTVSNVDDEKLLIAYNMVLGTLSSAAESGILEAFRSDGSPSMEATSTMVSFAEAAQAGQRFYAVDRNNLEALHQTSVDQITFDDMRNATHAGKGILVHQNPVDVGSWSGFGYIVVDPQTGAGAYKISGGANGGVVDTASLLDMGGLQLTLVGLLTDVKGWSKASGIVGILSLVIGLVQLVVTCIESGNYLGAITMAIGLIIVVALVIILLLFLAATGVSPLALVMITMFCSYIYGLVVNEMANDCSNTTETSDFERLLPVELLARPSTLSAGLRGVS